MKFEKVKTAITNKIIKLKALIINTNFPLLIDLIKWLLIDLYRAIKNGRKKHIFGIIGYVGDTGGGKTISLVRYLESMRKKHGDSIYIATNFYYKNQDFSIKSWRDLLPEYDKPIIFAYDELQNEFNSRDFKNFPDSLMYILTQNRKGNGKQIVYSVQDYGTVDINFRRLSLSIVFCRTRFGRLTRCKHFTREQYENLINTPDIRRRMKIRPYYTLTYVQSDYIRELYDSYAMIESFKKKEYIDRKERQIS